MIRKALAASALAVVVFLTAFPALADTATGQQIVGLVCSHQDLAVAALSLVVTGSVLSWFKTKLPAPIVHVANILGLNWDDVAKAAIGYLSKSAGVLMICIIGGALVLSACTQQAAQNLQATAQAAQTASVAVAKATATTISGVQQVVQTLQPVNAQLACLVQAQANLATAALTETHNTSAANESSTVSKVAGTFCNGLRAGAPLPTPVPVAGTTTITATGVGTVTLPTPVAAAASAPSSPATTPASP